MLNCIVYYLEINNSELNKMYYKLVITNKNYLAPVWVCGGIGAL